MKTMFNKMAQFLIVLFVLVISTLAINASALTTTRFENENLEITTKLPPQYLGWQVEQGSTTQTIPMYYKISAYVPGIGETVAGPVTTAYSTYSGLVSTNSLRLMWAPVNGATYYKLYRSSANTTFYLITSPTGLTYVDEGAANGAAYSAPSPAGGNLYVEGTLTVAGGISGKLKTNTLAVMNASIPLAAGELIYVSDGVSATKVCVSSGATVGGYTLATATATHCQ